MINAYHDQIKIWWQIYSLVNLAELETPCFESEVPGLNLMRHPSVYWSIWSHLSIIGLVGLDNLNHYSSSGAKNTLEVGVIVGLDKRPVSLIYFNRAELKI